MTYLSATCTDVGYVNTLNQQIAGQPLDSKSLEEVPAARQHPLSWHACSCAAC